MVRGVFRQAALCVAALCVVVMSAIVLPLSFAYAGDGEFDREIPFLRLWALYNPGKAPGPDAQWQRLIADFKGPIAPTLPKVTFYEFDRPTHIEGRVERLIHGIEITLPSEYDHYGYELRRYMNKIGRVDIYTNREAMEGELLNIQKAGIVFRHWREELLREIDELEAAIKVQGQGVSSKVKAKFNLNKTIVNGFVIEAQAWLAHNRRFLEFLADNRKQYAFENGRFLFLTNMHARQFLDLFQARAQARQQIVRYDPFGTAVY